MVEYIEREAIEEKLCSLVREYKVRGEEEKASGVFEALYRTRLLRSVELSHAVHGEWSIAIGYDPARTVMCDRCQRMACEPSKYCPNCGAKMYGGKE